MNWILKKRIAELYQSQANFAEVADISDAIVSKVIRGRLKLSLAEKRRWSFLLRSKPEEIFLADN